MKTIKQRITEAILARLNELTTEQTGVTRVRENNDLNAVGTYKIELIVIFGPEQEQSRDITGQLYHFDTHIKLFVPHPPPPADARRKFSFPELMAAVLQKVENIPALDGLATIALGAEELPYLKTGLSHIKGPFLRLTFEYRRKRANPFETYVPGVKEAGTVIEQVNNVTEIY
jgi:hypothetical protein